MATIAEATVAPREMVRYFGEGAKAGKECELAYNTTFMAAIWDAIATKDVRLLRKSMGRLPAKPLGTTWITYLRCHDDIKLEFNDQDIYSIGFDAQRHRAFLKNFYTGKYKKSTAKGAVFSNNPKTDDIRLSGTLAALAGLEHAVQLGNDLEKDLACRRIAMMHAVILAYGGLPMLYYGDELGSMNDYTYVQEDDKAYDNRWMHRPIMNWKAAEKRNDPESVQGYIFNSLKQNFERIFTNTALRLVNGCKWW